MLLVEYRRTPLYCLPATACPGGQAGVGVGRCGLALRFHFVRFLPNVKDVSDEDERRGYQIDQFIKFVYHDRAMSLAFFFEVFFHFSKLRIFLQLLGVFMNGVDYLTAFLLTMLVFDLL